MKKLILSFSILLFGTVIFAQPSNLSVDKCKTDKAHKELYTTNPVYHQKFDEAQTQIRNIISYGERGGGGIYTIPVVVHVMHLGSAEGTNENISDAQIQSAIDNLNDAYANIGYNGLDIQIQFALAVRDPNCQATDGINRINASGLTSGGDAYATKGATDNNRTALKALSNWSNTDYYNIWVVTEIDDNDGGAGTQGYAYFPGAPNGTDGTVILYNAFGYDPTGSIGYNLKNYTRYNATTIHELGHALDLFHTFEGDDANDDGNPDTCPPTAAGLGDECGDTDAHRRDDSDCQGGIQATCNGVNNSTVYNNFMAYSSDVCQNRFTANQKLRMRAAMEGPRVSLLNSLALTSAPAQAPNTLANSCSPTTSNSPGEGVTGNFGGILSVTFGNRTSITGNAKQDHDDYATLGYMDFSQDCLKYDEFEEGGNINITVGCHFNNHNVKVYVDWNNNGVFGAGEEALSLNTVGYTPSSGNITIPGGAVTGEYLRIRFNADIGTVNSACENSTYGQIEDYAIFINPTGGGNPPVANFSANLTTVCQNANVTFTSSSTDATSYDWNFGSGASPATATGVGPHIVSYTTSGNKTVTLDVIGPDGSDSETKTNYITVNSNVTPSVSIVASANPITSGTSVTFTATPTNGGTPSYQWKLNGGNVGSNSSTYTNSTLVNNNQVSCVMTSTATCASPATATSNTITMTVNGVLTLSQLKSSQCNQTVAGLTGSFYCEKITNAQDYRFQFSGGDLAAPLWVNRGGPFANILRSLIPGLNIGSTYQVRIRVKVGGVWGAYGPVCSVTIGPAMQGPDNTSRMEEEETINESIIATEFITYPNPTKGLLQVNIPELSMEGAILEVMDMNGKIIISQANVLSGTTSIDLSPFNNGLYLIRLIDGESVFMKKIIKE
jgi:PKD repeat protein